MTNLTQGADPSSGLTADEQRVIDLTVDLWNALHALDGIGGTDELHEANQAIHIIQNIIAARAMARLFPEIWR
mgnify:CR=1 FL=1